MERKGRSSALILALCLLIITGTGCNLGEGRGTGQSGNVDVNKYTMDLKLDTEKKTLSGTVIMDLTNNSGENIEKLCIRNYAASILEKRGKGSSEFRNITTKDGGKLDFTVGKDPSVVYVSLGDQSLAPGDSLILETEYRTDVPKANDRFGYRSEDGKDLFLLSFCFPQVAMYEDGRWNENPYIDDGESTCNKVTDYDIRLEAPKEYTVAASGDEETHGRITTIKAKDMRDMAIAASNYMEVETSTAAGVRINNYTLQYENSEKTNELTMAAVKDSVELFTDRFGKYPYEELDVIQCMIQGGMEYPGLVLIALWDMAPEDYLYHIDERSNYTYLCELISHEVGHEWFYAAVGNDQYEEPWLDEGFAEFCNIIYDLEKPDSLKRAVAFAKKLGGEDAGWIVYESEEETEKWDIPFTSYEKEPVINKPYDWYDNERGDYDTQVYSNGGLFLYELKKSMGEENFYDAMKEYYKTYCLKIAKGDDFLKIIKAYDDSEKTQKVIDKYIKN